MRSQCLQLSERFILLIPDIGPANARRTITYSYESEAELDAFDQPSKVTASSRRLRTAGEVLASLVRGRGTEDYYAAIATRGPFRASSYHAEVLAPEVLTVVGARLRMATVLQFGDHEKRTQISELRPESDRSTPRVHLHASGRAAPSPGRHEPVRDRDGYELLHQNSPAPPYWSSGARSHCGRDRVRSTYGWLGRTSGWIPPGEFDGSGSPCGVAGALRCLPDPARARIDASALYGTTDNADCSNAGRIRRRGLLGDRSRPQLPIRPLDQFGCRSALLLGDRCYGIRTRFQGGPRPIKGRLVMGKDTNGRAKHLGKLVTAGELIEAAEGKTDGEVRLVVGAGEVVEFGYDQHAAQARARSALDRVIADEHLEAQGAAKKALGKGLRTLKNVDPRRGGAG